MFRGISVRNLLIFHAALLPVMTCLTIVLSQPSDDDGISEAVFRYQMKHLAAERKRDVFYLAYGLTVPEGVSAEMMKRFADEKSRVRNYRRNEYNLGNLIAEKGIVVGISGIRYKNNGEAEVEGYHFVAPGEAEGYRCAVVRDGAEWAVKGCRGTWIV